MSRGWTGLSDTGDDSAELFTLPTEQFLILPEGRLSPAVPWLLGGGEILLWERLSMPLQLHHLKKFLLSNFFFFFSGKEGGCW